MRKTKRGRDVFNKYKVLLHLSSRLFALLPLRIRKIYFERNRYSKGKFGITIRYILLRSLARSCGDNVLVNQGVFILYPELLSIGNNVSFQPMCYVDAAGGIQIGDNVSMAHGVTILSSTHNYENNEMPIKDQGLSFSSTEIKNDVWIGAKATFLCGITINEGAILGAGAVVTHDVDEKKYCSRSTCERNKEKIR